MTATKPSIIRNASLLDGRRVDVRVEGGRIAGVDMAGAADKDAPGVDVQGGLLLPGLHDHHVHVAATAAAFASVRCGPPEITDGAALARALAEAPGKGWLRGVGYHESVAGMIDRHWLDRAVSHRPLRVQHRSGRMWIFNSAGLEVLLATDPAPPDALDPASGQLFDADGWLRAALGGGPPDLADMGGRWARWGVTGLTDMNPQNGAAEAVYMAAQHAAGALPQGVLLAGLPALATVSMGPGLTLGPVKVHLHEAHLPDHDALIATIRAAHGQGRGTAVHCVTETELVFTLAAFAEAGTIAGDRIEHASVAPDVLVAQIAALDLPVVAQPNFVAERGDAYLADIPAEEWPHLYRLDAFREAGVVLVGGTDTPFGSGDPWAAMAAAVRRRTASGRIFGAEEALTPEDALTLFLADPVDLGRTRQIVSGAPADLCLLEQNWTALRADLSAARVRATWIGGILVHDRIYQVPV
ncbi:amidohydrolase family protein [Sphingobium sp.]|uniref:amidohydrolase family protein n=1 Tax=Sphingobium sp. TaxID=1912891 RepID=UPI002BF14113|nr:amidohydrolase family protein [Sphingobium sp.]HUD89976.1 amidohydrolase family protein [Sphingobium sp.]